MLHTSKHEDNLKNKALKIKNVSIEELTPDKNAKSSNRNLRRRMSSGSPSHSIQLAEVHCSCERLQNQLFQFIDDFIASQEYQDYVNFKASIVRKDKEVQYDIADLNVLNTEQSEKPIDLSRRALRVFVLEKQIEKYASNLENAKVLKKQQNAINLIRQKIAEVKSIFLCHKKEREDRRKVKLQVVVQKFIKAHNIDVSRMLSTNRLDQVILDVERKLRMKRRTHKNNIKSIVEKLLREYKQKKTFNKPKKMKVRQLIHVEKGGIFHLKGRMNSVDLISSVHVRHSEDKVVRDFKEAGVCIEMEEQIQTKILMDENSSEEFQLSSDVSVQEEHSQFEIPNEDGFYKIHLDDSANQKLGIVKSFVEFENILEARHFLCLCEKERKDKDKMEIEYPDDTSLIIKPERINFKNFRNGKIYRKKLVLVNVSGHGVKIRLLKIYTEDPGQAIYFELETDEMIVVRPGIPLKYTLIFKPAENMHSVFGCMVFLICNKSTYYRRIVPIQCIPSAFEVVIDPLNVSFGTIPIWKFRKQPINISRTMKVKCTGDSPYKLVVKKVSDPFELSTVSSEEEEEYDDPSSEVQVISKNQAKLDVQAILDDIIQEVDSDFRIDRRFFKIDGDSEEQKLEVSLSADKYPGFFIEKYQFDIYEVNGKNEDVYKGIQEITLILEVSDYPVKCDPPCVDFGICFFSVAYQTKFTLINNSSVTQPVTVKIPSTLSYYVSTDAKTAFIRSGETREVTVKFLPSCDLATDMNKFYDPGTDILCFPIQVKLLNKQYADAPPLMQEVYAILCNCADLKLGPIYTHHYILAEGHMVLDMGECFVNEAVVTQIVLRNPCCSRIYYCFKNLPKYMTVMPNYGVGSIEACQELSLKLFIHPQLDDFDGGGFDPHVFNGANQFQISVKTMDKIGKYRRKPDQNRLLKLLKLMQKEMKKAEDTSMLEDICIARCVWKANMVECACESKSRRTTINSKKELEGFEAMLRELNQLEFSAGFQQLDVSYATTNSFTTDAGGYSEQSSMSSVTTVDMKLESFGKTQNQSVKKKKRKHSKRKTRDLSAMPSLTSFVNEVEDKPEKKDVRPLSTEIPLQIPTNSETNFIESLTSSLYVKTVFIKPLYEFSFNHIEFPATPGASFSMMTTELRPLKFQDEICSCGFESRIEKPKYRATFRIAGSTEEVRIEPTYGSLEHGESALITLVATPKINDDVVAGYAFDRKRSALLQEKLERVEQERREKAMVKRKPKAKTKNKKKKKVEEIQNPDEEKQEDESPPTVASDEVQVGILDFYPAEISIWRNIEPYFLNVNFVCYVEYDTEDFWYHPPDVFSLETVCKVIPPDFVHDQKTQHLDFGQVAVGESRKKIVTIQNIKYNTIVVRTSILRPHGSFTCPNFDPVRLPSESYLKIPITYTPIQEEKILEYMEIEAERTVYQFVLIAEGIQANIRIEPSAKVLRVLSKKGKTVEIPIEMKNDSNFPVTLTLEKVCELEGRIIPAPLPVNEEEIELKKTVKDKKKKKKDKIKSNKSSPRKKKNEMVNSDELTENEVYSIENNFEKIPGSPYFDFKEETGRINVMENSKSTFRILFGQPGQLHLHRSNFEQQSSKKNKKRGITNAIFPKELIGRTFIAKFNILLGTSVFLRDFIIVGEFK